MDERRWVIVSNRLPLTKEPGSHRLVQSSGGLVSAILGIEMQNKSLLWAGAAPPGLKPEEWDTESLDKESQYLPIFLPRKAYDRYYNGFSSEVLWPLFHYESQQVVFRWEDWLCYKQINQLFAENLLKVLKPNDLVWVHDFHLFLLPAYLKKEISDLNIGFFLHTPFPSSEIFRQLPVRREILEGVLHSDLIGFHDYSYLRHFCAAVQTILGLESSLLYVKRAQHTVRLGVFPVSIDTAKFQKKSQTKAVETLMSDYKKQGKREFLILGVDRLDYTKGLDLKLLAFEKFLSGFPEYRNRVSLLQIAVPTRTGVPEYQRLKDHIEQLVGRINGSFGKPNYTPVQYIYDSVDFEQLLALYRAADALLVTSKRDGMNLVALEYLASQDPENPGVVLLSEFTGAISTLSHVFPINPWDMVGTSSALAKVLQLTKQQRTERHGFMVNHLEKYTASRWAESFIDALTKSKEFTEHMAQIEIKDHEGSLILPDSLSSALRNRRLSVLLDYDGTLVPIRELPEDAILDKATRDFIRKLIKSQKTRLCMVSGRNRKFLVEQFKDLAVPLAAEHGARFYDPKIDKWESLVHSDKNSWYPAALQIMNDYASRVPLSFVEKKDFAIAWHFRQSPPDFANYQARKLKEELELGLSNLPVTILAGNRVIEARATEANKGAFTRWYLEHYPTAENEVVIAMGDDATDEDLFGSLPQEAVCIKVGDGPSCARYRLKSQNEVIRLLQSISSLSSI